MNDIQSKKDYMLISDANKKWEECKFSVLIIITIYPWNLRLLKGNLSLDFHISDDNTQ